MREAQYPLPDCDRREDAIDQVRRALGHAAPPAARTEAAPLAGKRDQAIHPAIAATESREATSQQAAREELAEFLLDESREPFAAARTLGLGQERFEMFQHDPMEDGPSGDFGS